MECNITALKAFVLLLFSPAYTFCFWNYCVYSSVLLDVSLDFTDIHQQMKTLRCSGGFLCVYFAAKCLLLRVT